ncbi:MAG: hypothetical protein O3B73_12030, partial [bacterium]|nr:hypothetical protein [bacterium]
MKNAPCDWVDLDLRFRKSTVLPGIPADHPDWWTFWHAHLLGRAKPNWFYSATTSPEWFSHHWPALTGRWIEAADEQLASPSHLAFRPEHLDNGDIDWGGNPTHSMTWAGFHYWGWANPLIRGYGVARNPHYATAFAGHLKAYFEQIDTFVPTLWEGADPNDRDWRDWITHNDLSAGIKMATFAEAVMVFAREPLWTADDLRRATLIVLRLAERLYGTYQNARTSMEVLMTYNFLTSGAAGLGVVAAIFPECTWSSAWLALATRILEVHVMELYYSDGGHKELCTQYHQAGLRDILFFEQVLAAQGKSYFLTVEPYRAKLLTCLRWLTGILMPDGTTSVLNSAAASTDWLIYCLVANKVLADPELDYHLGQWFSPAYIPRLKAIPA